MRSSLSGSILSTLSYHSKFNYPLTLDELHRFLLINRPVSSNEVTAELDKLVSQKRLIEFNSFYFLPKLLKLLKTLKLLNIRVKRRQASLPKLRLAARAARLIGFLPWINLVCVTGSLAMENSDETDDIDLMIVTARNRLWLARPLVVLLVSLFFKRRRPINNQQLTINNHSDKICLNLWLDEDALEMERHRQTVSTAHELAQMKPLVNKNHTYEKMLSLNKWGAKFLANFWSTIQQFNNLAINNQQLTINNQQSIANNSLNLLNLFLFRLQLQYMSRRRTSEEITLHSAFFHPSALKHKNTRTLKQLL